MKLQKKISIMQTFRHAFTIVLINLLFFLFILICFLTYCNFHKSKQSFTTSLQPIFSMASTSPSFSPSPTFPSKAPSIETYSPSTYPTSSPHVKVPVTTQRISSAMASMDRNLIDFEKDWNIPTSSSKNTIYVQASYFLRGRAGHLLNDFSTAVILANLFNWKLIVDSNPNSFKATREILDLDKINGKHQKGTCDKLMPTVRLNSTVHTFAYLHFEDMLKEVSEAFEGKRNLEEVCVFLQPVNRTRGTSWRIYLPHLYEWEYLGKIREGTYAKIIAQLRRGLIDIVNYEDHGWTTCAVHVRRGDLGHNGGKKYLTALLDLIDLIATKHNFGSCAFCRVKIFTESEHSEDVFELGCERMKIQGINCTVSSSSLRNDFNQMVTSDILVMASSSVSAWASLLGNHSHVYLIPGFERIGHYIYPQYLPMKYVDFSPVHQQVCFTYQKSHLLPIECSMEGVLPTLKPHFQEWIRERYRSKQ